MSRRFGPVLVGFTVIAVILTHSLVRITTERNIQNTIHNVLSKELARETIALDDYQFKQHDDSVVVLATVRSPQIIRPSRVTELQATLEKELERPTELVVRTMVAEDVAAVGSDVKVGPIDLNGVFFSTKLSERERKKRLARQVLLEELDSGGGFQLINLEYGENPGGTLVYATIKAIRPPQANEVAAVEKLLQERLDDPNAGLVLQCSSATILSRDGPLLIEWTQYGKTLDEQPEDLAGVRSVIEAEVKRIPDVFPVAVHFNIEEDRWQALAEVVGPRPVSPTELSLVQEAVSKSISHPVEISIWHRADIVVTEDGYESYKDFTRNTLEERIEKLPEIFEDMAAK